MRTNYIKCGDCLKLMSELPDKCIDIVFTSPPYNTGRKTNSEKARENHWGRYDIYLDSKTNEQYIDWCCELFEEFDRLLQKNGVVCWNVSYGTDSLQNNQDLVWLVIAEIIKQTNFTVADKIVWKKKSALPINTSGNKLTRICEDVFIFARKTELKTFNCNKEVLSKSRTGQNYYSNIYNFVEAKNNDGSCPLNKATFSSEFAEKILTIYAPLDWKEDCIVLDPFNGTGSTGVACKRLGISYIGFELSKEQCKWSVKRIKEIENER